MSFAKAISSDAPIPAEAVPSKRAPLLGRILVDDGLVTSTELDWALSRQRRHLCSLGHVLSSHGMVSEVELYRALARQKGAGLLRGASTIPSPVLLDRLGVETCARLGVLPVRVAGGVTIVATSRPFAFEAVRPRIASHLGPVAMAVMPESELRRKLIAVRQHGLVSHAETRVEMGESCRTFGGRTLWNIAALLIGVVVLSAIHAPVTTFVAAAALACTVLLVNTTLLGVAMQIARAPAESVTTDSLALARLPRVSILVPLFRERAIAGTLIERLSILDYPGELLDVCLIVEESDDITRDTLARTELPVWMRTVAVPDGSVRTKPRAMNYALDFCDGDVVGVYDAEDAPPADQILRVVQQFARSPAQVGCLQGRLNFYNPRASWLTRCFTVDYATWFGLVLPALHRLGWPIPLGGTTVFFRRAALEDVGGWDAHNVTEDADLGMRLARRGYRTDLLDSTTLEEATAEPRAWIHQRSRWLKGYVITWAVHMRDPMRLMRDLGPWRFVGFQVLFLGSLLGTLLAPVLWSFWLLTFGLPHPLAGVFSGGFAVLTVVILAGSGILAMAANVQALLRARRGHMVTAVPLMLFYHPLATVALAKALWEVVTRPFFWDKTPHGVTPPDIAAEMAEAEGAPAAE